MSERDLSIHVLAAAVLLMVLVGTAGCASSGAGTANVTAVCVGSIGGGTVIGGVAGRMIGDSMGSRTAGTIIGAAAGGAVGITICRRAWLQAQALMEKIDEVERVPMQDSTMVVEAASMLDEVNEAAVVVPEEPLPPLPKPKDSYNLEVVENRSVRFDLNSSLLFEVGSSTLQPSALRRLNVVAESLIQYPDSKISVIGHTDDTGSDDLNQRLSEARANSVVRYFTLKGVGPDRLGGIGRGEAEPRFPNDTAYRRALNRRVEIIIIPT